jgi:hypothetical protein
MEIFWAVFFGSSIGLFSVNLITSIVDDYRYKKRHQRVHDLLDSLEDADFDEYDD